MTDSPTFLAPVLAAIAAFDERGRILAERRIFAHQPATLQELGDEWRVSRERVRQLEARLLRRFTAVDRDALDPALARLRLDRTTPLYVSELPAADPWFDGVAEHAGVLAGALRSFDCVHRVADSPGGPYVTPREFEDLDGLLGECRRVLTAGDLDRKAITQREARLAELLTERGIGDLTRIVADELRRRTPESLTPTDADRIALVLRAAEGPLTLADLRRSLGSIDDRRLSILLQRLDVVRDRDGHFAMRESMDRWLDLLPQVREDVVAFMSCDPEQQWCGVDLLKALAEAGATWTAGMPAIALERLLREMPELRHLRRSIWGLAEVHTERIHILDLAVDILREAGAPLQSDELLARIRARRSLGLKWRPRYPVVGFGDGTIGLADRDLGLDEPTWKAFVADLDVKSRTSERVDLERLDELLVARGGPRLANDVIKRLVAGEHSLNRRLRKATGESRCESPG